MASESTILSWFERFKRPCRTAASVALAGAILTPLAMVAASLALPHESEVQRIVWQQHRALCKALPEEVYHLDRWRAVRGYVTDGDGRPIEGVLVQSINLESILKLAEAGAPMPDAWTGLVETETRTDEHGAYEFPHLPVGARTFCYSTEGKSPAIQELVVVQDGVGARLDVTLGEPKELRVRVEAMADGEIEPMRVYLIPHRWWSSLLSLPVMSPDEPIVFSGLGGPFQKGLIAVGADDGSMWRIVGRYDLDSSSDVTISWTEGFAPTPLQLPEFACIGALNAEALRAAPHSPAPLAGGGRSEGISEMTERQPMNSAAHRHFYSALSPTALFWNADRPASGEATATGTIHGFAPNPFLPLLVVSEDGHAWFGRTGDASEFQFSGLPTGCCRIRSLRCFAQQTFARGVFVRPGGVAELKTGLGEHIDFDEPRSREVMGFVRWENGEPVKDAEVFLQDATNFRRFLQRAVSDEHGFYRISNVPGDAPYFAFSLPKDATSAIKNFEYPRVDSEHREDWQNLTVHPHRVVGQFEDSAGTRLELVRLDDVGGEQVGWSFSTTEGGQFEVSNVPHGTYLVRAVGKYPVSVRQSMPFDVGDGAFATLVEWPETQL